MTPAVVAPKLVFWLVLACLGPVPDVVIGSLPDPHKPDNCELQTYARPQSLGDQAYVAVCSGWARPSYQSCMESSLLRKVSDLGQGDYVAGEYYDYVSAKATADVLPARAIRWGVAGPEPQPWFWVEAGTWTLGVLVASAIFVIILLLSRGPEE